MPKRSELFVSEMQRRILFAQIALDSALADPDANHAFAWGKYHGLCDMALALMDAVGGSPARQTEQTNRLYDLINQPIIKYNLSLQRLFLVRVLRAMSSSRQD